MSQNHQIESLIPTGESAALAADEGITLREGDTIHSNTLIRPFGPPSPEVRRDKNNSLKLRSSFLAQTLPTILLCTLAFSPIHAETLLRGNGPEPDSLDPQRAQGLSAQSVLRDLYEGLTRMDARGQIEPALAERFEASGDGLTWTFYLRPQLKFSDGSPITAEDFAYSLKRAVNPKTAAPYGNQLTVIAGGEACLKAQICDLGVRAVDPQTLEIRLVQPAANLPARLSLPVASVLKQSNVEQFGDRFTRPQNLVSSGPYQLQEWRPLAFLRLGKNPHHREAKQLGIETVEFHVTEDASAEARRFENGELHLTETVPPGRHAALKQRFGSRLRVADSLGSFFLGFNLATAPAKDNLALRQALSLAIDRQKITHLITGMGERPSVNLLPAGLGQEVKALSPFAVDLQSARKLYQSAGFDVDNPLEIELRYNTSLLNRKLMLAISVMWEQNLGVKTVMRQEEWKVFVQNRKARRITQVFRYGWNADLADSVDFLQLFHSQSPLNVTGFKDPNFDLGLRQLEATLDPKRALRLAAELEEKVLSSAAIIPLFQYTSKHLVSDRLAGFYDHPLDHHPTRFLSWQ